MEKTDLISILSKFTNPDSFSVDLYFIFKTGDTYTHYLTNPNDDLRDKIKSSFSAEIARYTDEANPYNIHSIYDDNDYEEFNLFSDPIEHNEVAKSIFIFDKPQIAEYTASVGKLSQVNSFLIEFSNAEEKLFIYKQNIPTSAVSSSKVINIAFGQGNNFKLINEDAIHFNKSIDLMAINNEVIIISRAVYESRFGFKAELEKKAHAKFEQLTATNLFECKENILRDSMDRLTKKAKKQLSNIDSNNPVLKKISSGTYKKNPILIHAVKYVNHTFQVNSTGQIAVSTLEDLKVLIKILNRDYNINEITEEKFDTSSKKLLA